MARQQREATAADVRAWALETKWTDAGGNGVGERGRFSSELVQAFNQAHRRNNIAYGGGSGGNSSGNSTPVATRSQSRSSDSSTSRRAPSGTARQETQTAPARTRQRQSSNEGMSTAVIGPAGSGLSDAQVEQFSRMLADANAVTGVQNEITFVRIAPAAVA